MDSSMPDQPKMRLNGALVRTIRPSLLSVAMAKGVSLKKREKRISAARSSSSPGAARAVEDERAGLAELAVGEARGAMQQPHGQGRAVAADEVDVDDLGADVAFAAAAHEQACPVAADDVGQPDGTGIEFG
jgi:hypothetical protein